MLACLSLRIWCNIYETVTLVMHTGHWCMSCSQSIYLIFRRKEWLGKQKVVILYVMVHSSTSMLHHLLIQHYLVCEYMYDKETVILRTCMKGAWLRWWWSSGYITMEECLLLKKYPVSKDKENNGLLGYDAMWCECQATNIYRNTLAP